MPLCKSSTLKAEFQEFSSFVKIEGTLCVKSKEGHEFWVPLSSLTAPSVGCQCMPRQSHKPFRYKLVQEMSCTNLDLIYSVSALEFSFNFFLMTMFMQGLCLQKALKPTGAFIAFFVFY